jgi:hypothetical protein
MAEKKGRRDKEIEKLACERDMWRRLNAFNVEKAASLRREVKKWRREAKDMKFLIRSIAEGRVKLGPEDE